ncbi:hypothetical protein BROUX41_006714 [Berkeleyomyces rouxiae]
MTRNTPVDIKPAPPGGHGPATRLTTDMIGTCLKGPAITWYLRSLTGTERRLLRTADIEAICTTLEEKFRKQRQQAVRELRTATFTLRKIHEGQDIMTYLSNFINNAQAVNMDDATCVIWAYESLCPGI